jgi:hypothetical protein
MTLYFTGALVVSSIILNAFLKDDSTPKTHISSWIVIALATLAWPVVLPFIIRKKLRREENLEFDYLN